MLVGLGIRHLGPTAAQAVARALGDLDRIEAASVEELTAVDGIGPVIAESVQRFFAIEGNRVVVEKLRAAGVDLTAPMAVAGEAPPGGVRSTGLTFVLTGGLEGFTRDEAQAEIEARGGKVTEQRLEEDEPTSWPARAPARSWPRPSSSAWPLLDEAGFVDLLEHGPPA